ncbi:MAG: hypothetical protein WCL10_11085 [Novosphingobium sp.]|jgi:hypothetical protein|uniref:hypothetical protein n=1 Tax=Novosphingobium sp. TaxID=1874826 RepID=UPI0030173694
MPEFMGIKITRAQESARHAYRRALEKAVRAASKGSGWRSIEGCLFREQAGWFVSVCPSVFINVEATKATVSAKPMAIDPIFWDIVGLPENANTPLSFRLNGAWTCQPPPFDEVSIEENTDANFVAARLLDTANEHLAAVERWSVEDFLQLCRNSGATEDSYLPCVVTTLHALNRDSEALDTCKSAIARGDSGGFLSPDGSFSEMATRWITASLTKATRH